MQAVIGGVAAQEAMKVREMGFKRILLFVFLRL
jgi:hypothetical protein